MRWPRYWRFWSCTTALHAKLFFANVHGRSIMHKREVWELGGRYPDRGLSEDAAFLRKALDAKRLIYMLAKNGQMIYIRQTQMPGHLSSAGTAGRMVGEQPRLPPFSRKRISSGICGSVRSQAHQHAQSMFVAAGEDQAAYRSFVKT